MERAEDRISYLPDHVLQSILTMLPLKSAIRTDVLSKKWRNLWKYSLSTATTLEFGEDVANNLSAKDFVETVNRYLSQNESKKLESFRIFFCPFDLFASEIVSWISFAAGKGVRYLDIDLSQGFRNPADNEFTDGRSFVLPSSLFNCDSLSDLRVSCCFFFTPLNLSNFGGLQSLSISHSNINEEMLQSILTECSLLESLSLRTCLHLRVISITVPDLKLKRLTIGDCFQAELLEINAPKLQSFHYFGRLYVETNLSNLFSLEDAAIYSIGRNFGPDYMDLLSGLSHVQTLTLCKATLVQLKFNEENYSEFQIELQNLHELQLVMTSMTDEDLTCFCTFFYRCSSPFLEKLFILLPTHIDDPNVEVYGVHVLNPLSLDDITFDHLKMIKVTNFKGSRNEMRLNDSKKLERFRIFFCPFDMFACEIESWISFATGKGVRYLDIDLSQGFRSPADGEFTDGRSPFELPSSLFNCDSLTDLGISRCFFFTPSNRSNFGGLQSLSKCHSNINEEMLQSILTECSLLENLSLRSCQQLGVISITVPDLELKRLTIGDCWSADLLEINAPKLQSFHYFGRLCIETNL